MFAANQAKTGIAHVDQTIYKYLHYLAAANILPSGNYALAGGCMRSMFDKSRVSDLDIYILGDSDEHDRIIHELSQVTRGSVCFSHCSAAFELINITVNEVYRWMKDHPQEQEDTFFADGADKFHGATQPESIAFSGDIQVISFKYDSKYATRDMTKVPPNSSFIDSSATCLQDILDSYDVTLSKAGIEFTINKSAVAVTEVCISQEFLLDVCLKQIRFNPGRTDVPGIPQQLTSLKRFYKLITLGYTPTSDFFLEWNIKLAANPYALKLSYDQ